MYQHPFENFSEEGVEVKVSDGSNPEEVNITFHGKINVKNPDELIWGYLENLHNNVIKNNIKKVIIDFTDLEFVNSSAFKVIFKWFLTNNQSPDDKKYNIKLIYKKDISWQHISFNTIDRVFKTIEKVVN